MPITYAGPFDVFLHKKSGGAEYVSRHHDPDAAYKAARALADRSGHRTSVMDLWTMHTMREFRPSGPKDWTPGKRR